MRRDDLPPKRRPSWLPPALAAGVVLLLAALGVATNQATALFPATSGWAANVWLWGTLTAVLALVAAGLTAWQTRVAAPSTGDDDAPGKVSQLDRAAAALATAVRLQLRAEVGRLELCRPEPLRLTWSATNRSVTAPAETVLGRRVAGRVTRLRLDGHLGEVFDRFVALGHTRRVVVLGTPGAGKSALAMLLTLELLARRRPGDPVPVLLGLSSWNPNEQSLDDWIARRLGEDYPGLRHFANGADVATELALSGDRILPVLDGLDELPEKLRGEAIRALDAAGTDRSIVVTCRGEEYEQAIATGCGALAKAVVVELEPLTAEEAIGWLRTAAAPSGDRWDGVAAELRAAPDGALAAAFSLPLMVALARRIYSNPHRDPAELVDLARTRGQAAVEEHLLEGFVPAAFADVHPALGVTAGGRRRWEPDQVRRWLTTLATHTDQQSRELAWWELVCFVPPRVVRFVFGLTTGLAIGLALWVAFGSVVWFFTGFISALALWLILPGRKTQPTVPSQVSLQPRDLVGALVTKLVSSFKPMLTVGLIVGLAVGLVSGVAAELGPIGGTVGGLAGLAAAVLAVVFTVAVTAAFEAVLEGGLQRPVDAAVVVTPRASLDRDRTVAIVLTFALGLACGFFGLVVGLFRGSSVGFVAGFVAGFGLASSLTAWAQFVIARAWFAARGHLPWRLMTFLEEAHRRGVLRQAGAVYQFRHARLQEQFVKAALGERHRSGGVSPRAWPAISSDSRSNDSE